MSFGYRIRAVRGLRAQATVCAILVLGIGGSFVPAEAQPLREPSAAGFLEPAPGGHLYVTPAWLDNPPNLIHLLRVTDGEIDAASYRIEMTGPVASFFDITVGVAGEDVISTLVLPPDIVPATYELRCAGLDAGGLLLGDWSPPIPVQVVELMPVPVTPIGPTNMSGLIIATEVVIPLGVVVTAIEDLTILSLGPVNIAGAIIGRDGLSEGQDGASVRILASQSIEMSGTIAGGAGAAGQAVATIGLLAQGGDGGRGGDVALLGHGAAIHVSETAILVSGRGGDGGGAHAQGEDAGAPGDVGGDAEAIGGGGGGGGYLAVGAFGSNLLHPYLFGIFHCGDGGVGGDAEATGGRGGAGEDDLPEGPGGGATASGGGGGASGSLYVAAQDLDANGDQQLEPHELEIVAGGAGGQGGDAIPTAGQNGVPDEGKDNRADCFRPNGQKPPPVQAYGAKGGDGWAHPGIGMPAFAYGLGGPPGGDGGDALAVGGQGGNLKMVGVSLGPVSLGFATSSWAARGGDGFAKGGNGGAPSGGGGNGSATGGKGGSGPVVGYPCGGGRGGDATAIGGNGQRGPDCCQPPQGNPHNGGNGGGAYAIGGDGGDASLIGGDGGNARAAAGRCGNGGDGNGPSAGGIPGPANASGGNGGTASVVNGSNGTGRQSPSASCAPGKLCAPECNDGVRTKDIGEPVDGVENCHDHSPDKALVPCALFCPAGDLGVVSLIFEDDLSGLPIVGLPADRYGIEVDGIFYPGAGPTDATGRGVIPFAAADAMRDGCRDGYIVACGTVVYGPFKILSVDINADGIVDQDDLDEIQPYLGSTQSCYDLDGDGVVTAADVALVNQHLGHVNPATAVDLPPALALTLASYPNPFNPRTTIGFTLPAAGTVRLQIVDVAGRAIRGLVAELLPAGRHEVDWNGQDDQGRLVAAGVYLIVLQTSRETRTGKVAVLK